MDQVDRNNKIAAQLEPKVASLTPMDVAVILLPALIAIGMLNYSTPARVALKVYLPCLLLVPMYLGFNLGGLVLNATSIVTLLVVGATLVTWNFRYEFSIVDLCVLLYVVGSFYSDMNQGAAKLGIYALSVTFSKCLLPYIIGRLLIEQPGLRSEYVTTIVLCLAFIGIFSIIEYLAPFNLFISIARKLTHHESGWSRQTRWGFGRIAGPYGSAITASMIFSTAFLLQLWLVGLKRWDVWARVRGFGARRTRLSITWAVLLGLFMTQSRGPWIGFVFGAIIAATGFARNRKRAAIISISTLLILGSVTYVVLDKYTALNNTHVEGDQENATYRRNLIVVYQPLIEAGGLWGWGTPRFNNHGVGSWLPDHDSLDNEYLRIGMAQGYLGMGTFVMMFAFSIFRLAKLCVQFRNRDDILFAYCLIGTFLAMMFSLSTVFMGDPMMQIVFLFIGWSQSLAPTKSAEQAALPAPMREFAFERVFV